MRLAKSDVYLKKVTLAATGLTVGGKNRSKKSHVGWKRERERGSVSELPESHVTDTRVCTLIRSTRGEQSWPGSMARPGGQKLGCLPAGGRLLLSKEAETTS